MASEVPQAQTGSQSHNTSETKSGIKPSLATSIDNVEANTGSSVGSNKPISNVESDEVIKDKSKIDFTEGGNFKFYPDNPENHRHKYRWVNKEPSKFYDPCEESRQASMNCVLRNQLDKTVCQDFFDAYTECKTDFFKKKNKDRRQGKGGWGFWD